MDNYVAFQSNTEGEIQQGIAVISMQVTLFTLDADDDTNNGILCSDHGQGVGRPSIHEQK